MIDGPEGKFQQRFDGGIPQSVGNLETLNMCDIRAESLDRLFDKYIANSAYVFIKAHGLKDEDIKILLTSGLERLKNET